MLSKKARIRNKIVLYIILIALTIIAVFPILIMLSTSLKSLGEIRTSSFNLIPQTFHFENFAKFLQSGNWGRYFYNSLYCAVFATVISYLTNSIGGYAFARLHFKGKNFLFALVMVGMMVPIQSIMLPVYLQIKNLPLAGGNNILGVGGHGLLDSNWGIIAPLMAGAVGLFLTRQYYLGFPTALDDAAKIDGCSPLRTYFSIYFPLSGPILTTLIILKFTDGYNQYLWPLLVINSMDGQTVQLALAAFKGSDVVQWDLLMAGTVVACLPIVILFFALQKHYVKGIVSTGVKG